LIPSDVVGELERIETRANGAHEHNAADITSGVIAAARISEASVTQHQAALDLDAAQVATGVFDVARIPDLDAAKIASGQLADARISASSVRQHIGRFVAVTENTDTTTDLVGATVPLTGASVQVDADEYAVSGDGIEVTTAGVHRVSATVDWTTGGSVELTFRAAVNGTPTGPVSAGPLVVMLDLSAGDIVTIEATGTGAGTAEMAAAGTSQLSVEIVR
jgi:hypothetical protein